MKNVNKNHHRYSHQNHQIIQILENAKIEITRKFDKLQQCIDMKVYTYLYYTYIHLYKTIAYTTITSEKNQTQAYIEHKNRLNFHFNWLIVQMLLMMLRAPVGC
jgi:hypothetical protein